MLKMFKKAIWIPYEDVFVYPTVAIAHQTIAEYCERNDISYTFLDDDSVIMNGIEHEIYRGTSLANRGCYGIKCREK